MRLLNSLDHPISFDILPSRMNKVFANADEAIFDIKDGAAIIHKHGGQLYVYRTRANPNTKDS